MQTTLLRSPLARQRQVGAGQGEALGRVGGPGGFGLPMVCCCCCCCCPGRGRSGVGESAWPGMPLWQGEVVTVLDLAGEGAGGSVRGVAAPARVSRTARAPATREPGGCWARRHVELVAAAARCCRVPGGPGTCRRIVQGKTHDGKLCLVRRFCFCSFRCSHSRCQVHACLLSVRTRIRSINEECQKAAEIGGRIPPGRGQLPCVIYDRACFCHGSACARPG